MTRWCIAIIVMVTTGCNPVQQIAQDTNEIRTEARALVDHGRETNDKEVVNRATRIDGLAAGIHEDLSSVEAKTSPWVSTLTWLAIAAAAVAGYFILAQSGALTFLRIAVGWLPRKKVAEAELAHKMLSNDAETPREYVAARRADPEFDAAWRKINKEKSCSQPSNPCSDQSSSQRSASSADMPPATSSQ